MSKDDGLLEVMSEEDPNPEDMYSPKGTPETALIITLTSDQYHVVHHTGRYFHALVECAGHQGEEIGMDDVPDEPGVWFFSEGKVWTSTDWESGVQDDCGISGEWRRATPEDFKDAGLELPHGLGAPPLVDCVGPQRGPVRGVRRPAGARVREVRRVARLEGPGRGRA